MVSCAPIVNRCIRAQPGLCTALTHPHKKWDRKYVTLVLASQSPRRTEILRQAGIPFTVRVAPVDETPLPGEPPVAYVERLAEMKAAAVDAAPDEIVIAADTTVVIDGHMLGKPAGVADARRMLSLLSGRRHEVITGICLRRGAQRMVDHAVTAVWFAPMSEPEIADYAASAEPMDKAGAYAIQGLASKFITAIDGCYFNVVGLPIAVLYRHLNSAGRPWYFGFDAHRESVSGSASV